MEISTAQREVRAHFVGGFYGQLVSATLWMIAASLGTWSTTRAAITTVVIGGFFIFPVTTLIVRVRSSCCRRARIQVSVAGPL